MRPTQTSQTFRFQARATRVKGIRLLWGLFLALGNLGVAQSADLSLEIPARLEVAAGDFTVLPVQIRGEAATPCVEATLSYRLPIGWQAVSSERSVCVSGLLEEILALKVPPGARAQTYPIEVELRGPSGPAVRQTTQIKVKPYLGFTLEGPAEVLLQTGLPQRVALRLNHNGNDRETYIVKVTGARLLSPSRVTLEPGTGAEVLVRFEPSAISAGGNFEVEVVSATDLSLREVEIVVLGSTDGNASTNPLEDRSQLSLKAGGDGSVDVLEGSYPWAAGLDLELNGDLSDYTTLYSRYRLDYDSTRKLNTDRFVLDLEREEHAFSVNASALGSSFLAFYRFQPRVWSWGLGVGRSGGEAGQFYARAETLIESGLGAVAQYTLGRPELEGNAAYDEQRVSATYSRQFGDLTPRLELGVTRLARPEPLWGWRIAQGLGYQHPLFLLDQSALYDSLSDRGQFKVNLISRSVDPFSLQGTLEATLLRGVLLYSADVAAGYQVGTDLSTTATLAYGSFGPAATWAVNYNPSFPWGQVVLFNRARYSASGLEDSYSAGLEGVYEAISGRIYLTGDLLGLNGYGAEAQYTPDSGVQLLTEYGASQADGSWTHKLRGGIGYGQEDWALGTEVQQLWNPDGSTLSFGLSGSVQVLPELGLKLTYSANDRGSQSLRLGASFSLGTAFEVSEGIQEVFGGSRSGTLELSTFLDRNRNGTRDPQEPPLPIQVSLNGQAAVQTDSSGQLSTRLKVGSYRVNLGPDTALRYGLSSLPSVQIAERQTQKLELPIVEVVTVRGRVFLDQNANAKQDEGETPVSEGTINVESDTFSGVARLDSLGSFTLSGLAPDLYRVSLNPTDLWKVQPPLELDLRGTAETPLLELPAQPLAREDTVSYRQGDLGLTLTPIEDRLPVGAEFLLEAETNLKADSVTLSAVGQTLDMRSEDGLRWQVTLKLPAGVEGTQLFRVLARQGDQGSEGQGYLQIEADEPLNRLKFSPNTALAGQLLNVELISYANPQKVEIQGEDGAKTPLERREYTRFTGRLRAATTAGEHHFTLWLEGVEVGRYTYTVLE